MTLTPEQVSSLRTSAGLSATPPAASASGANDIIASRRAALGMDQPAAPAPAPGIGDRISSDISSAGDKMKKQIAGTDEFAGQSAVERGVGAVATGFNAIPKVASEFLPKTGNGDAATIEKIKASPEFQAELQKHPDGAGLGLLINKIGDIPALQKWTNEHPDAFKALSGILGTASSAGQISSDILAIDQGAKGFQAVADNAPGVAKAAVDKGKEVFQSIKDSRAEGAVTKNDAFVKDLITPELSKKGLTTAIKTGKVVENTGVVSGERDISGAVPNFDKIEASVKQVPGLSPSNTNLQNVNAIHDEIGNVAENLKSQLQGKGQFNPEEFKGYMKSVQSDLADNPMIVGDAEKTAEKILNKFSSLVDEQGYDANGVLEARKGLDQWMSSQKGSNIFDPAKENAISVALRAIRQGGNNFIAEKVPDVAVKELLGHQSNLYSAIENIAPKAAGEGSTGLERIINRFPKAANIAKAGVKAVGLGAGLHLVP